MLSRLRCPVKSSCKKDAKLHYWYRYASNVPYNDIGMVDETDYVSLYCERVLQWGRNLNCHWRIWRITTHVFISKDIQLPSFLKMLTI